MELLRSLSRSRSVPRMRSTAYGTHPKFETVARNREDSLNKLWTSFGITVILRMTFSCMTKTASPN